MQRGGERLKENLSDATGGGWRLEDTLRDATGWGAVGGEFT